jgi:chaperonin cofactor prefoldin
VKKKGIAMSNVDGLAAEWLQLKAQEKEVIAKRHAVEKQITEALDAKDEGTISHISADAVGCRYLAEKEPVLWRKVAKAFETKQGKIGVKVEEI